MQFFSRCFLIIFLIALASGCQPAGRLSAKAINATASPRMNVLSQREYEVHQRLDLVNEGG
jgi:hypothetical protein